VSGFKDMVAADIRNVFFNPSEFAKPRTVKYDGETYTDIPIVLSRLKETDRRTIVHNVHDYAQGLYQVTGVLYCAVSDIGGKKPEKGQRIKINDEKGGGGFFYEFYVASSGCEMGMLRVELGAIDE